MTPKRLACICLITMIAAVSSCSTPNIATPIFDGDRAFDHLVNQVEFGPRVPGSKSSTRCRSYMYHFFDSLGLRVDSQMFTFLDPYSGMDIPMVNVIAHSHPLDASPRLVLMAHYDSRPRTDYAFDTLLADEPIDGANDGASGVAVLLEVARLLAGQPPSVGVDLVFVDGEDWGKSGDSHNYLLGSREFARRGIRGRYQFGIVIDMIGDRNQKVYREALSDRYSQALNDLVWETARRLSITTFIDSVKHAIHDDHLSLQSSGVPSIVLIDFDYPEWHTEFDRADKCSAQSLTNVGRILIDIIYNPSRWPDL